MLLKPPQRTVGETRVTSPGSGATRRVPRHREPPRARREPKTPHAHLQSGRTAFSVWNFLYLLSVPYGPGAAQARRFETLSQVTHDAESELRHLSVTDPPTCVCAYAEHSVR